MLNNLKYINFLSKVNENHNCALKTKRNIFEYEIKIKMFVWWIFQQHSEICEANVWCKKKFDSLIYKKIKLLFCFENDKQCDDDFNNIGYCKYHCH